MKSEGKSREQIAELGLVGTSGYAATPTVGLKDRIS